MNIYLGNRTINTLCAIGCLCKPKVLAKNVAREAANHAVREVLSHMNMRDSGGMYPEWALSDKQRRDLLKEMDDE